MVVVEVVLIEEDELEVLEVREVEVEVEVEVEEVLLVEVEERVVTLEAPQVGLLGAT